MRQFLNNDIVADFNNKDNNHYEARFNNTTYVEEGTIKRDNNDVETVDFDGFDSPQSSILPEAGFSFDEIKKDINDFNINDDNIEIL